MGEKQLKPCPFCGRPGERWIDESGDSSFPVHGCSHCAEMFYGDESEWNTRPIEDALQAEVSRLRAALEWSEKYASSHCARYENTSEPAFDFAYMAAMIKRTLKRGNNEHTQTAG